MYGSQSGVWAILYVMDYIFTLKAARMYQEGANKHFVFPGGIELNPYFKEDVAHLRRFSFRFFLLLFYVGGLLLIAHSIDVPELFAFACLTTLNRLEEKQIIVPARRISACSGLG